MSDFEGAGTNITLEQFGTGPAATIANMGGNPGGVLQLTQPVNDSHNWATFDQTNDPGDFDGFETSTFSFDFNITPMPGSADGFSFSYADTSVYGETGGVTAAPFTAEDPAAPGILGIGFDTYANGGALDGTATPPDDYNEISLFWDGALIQRVSDTRDVLDPPLTLDDGMWHNVDGMVNFLDQTVSLNVDGNPIFTDLAVPGLVPFESRIMLAGRTGGINEDLRLDNVDVQWENPANAPLAGEQPAPTAGNWSVREWSPGIAVNSTAEAEAIMNDPTYQTIRYVKDDMAPMVNFNDPQAAGGGYSILPNAGRLAKTPLLSNGAGDDNDIVMRAAATVVIPEDGQYTFGFDGDDGARLTIPGADFTLQASTPNAQGESATASGDTIDYLPPTGSAFTTASTFLTAGEHDIEVVWFERAGGAFVEVFAAPGIQTGADGNAIENYSQGFAPIGWTEELVVSQGTLPTTAAGWNVRQVEVDPTAFVSSDSTPETEILGLNNLTDARTAVELDDSDPLVEFSLELPDTTINYSDPDTNPTPGSGRFLDDTPFPIDLQGTDDDHFATLATATINIPEDNDYIFGFGSDDGASLFVEGADFTILSTAGGVGEVTNEGQTMEFDLNTGNSDTYGTTFLSAGEYDIEFLSWERAGGAWAEVYVGVGSEVESILSARLLGSPSETFDIVIPAGLALAGEGGATIPGDYNNNGRVEQADLDLVLLNWNESVDNLPEDWINERPTSGIIDQAELDGVLLNWNRTTPGVAAVPEPGTIVLLLIAAGLGLGLIQKR